MVHPSLLSVYPWFFGYRLQVWQEKPITRRSFDSLTHREGCFQQWLWATVMKSLKFSALKKPSRWRKLLQSIQETGYRDGSSVKPNLLSQYLYLSSPSKTVWEPQPTEGWLDPNHNHFLQDMRSVKKWGPVPFWPALFGACGYLFLQDTVRLDLYVIRYLWRLLFKRPLSRSPQVLPVDSLRVVCKFLEIYLRN